MAIYEDPTATEIAAELLERLYPLEPGARTTLDVMPESSLEDGYLAYQVRAGSSADSPVQWVLRAHRQRRRMPDYFRYFYPWVCLPLESSQGAGMCDMDAWLKTRTATLTRLEDLEYPCPRLVPTREGTSVGEANGWCALVTTFVAGTVLTPTLAQVRLMGSALGRLHALAVSAPDHVGGSISEGAPGLSYWHPAYAIPSALARLRATATHVPTELRPWHTAFKATMEQMRQAELPIHLIHGDAWSANAVFASLDEASDEVTFIDWDQGGQGPAMADLGRLLLECHLNTNLPVEDALAWHITPDPQRIEAVVEGYAKYRYPSPAELDALLVATRFGVAFIGALHLDQALHAASTDPAWVAGMERRVARLQNRYQVSEEIVALAIEHFERIQRRRGH